MKQHEMRVAVYMRFARKEEDSSAAEQQKEILRKFVEEQGFTAPVCFMDNGYSGLTLDRPAFNEMDAAIKAGEIHAVVVRDLSRIGRCYLTARPWIDDLIQRGVKLICEDGSHEAASLPDISAAVAGYFEERRGEKLAK